ncbi:Uncharacterised protein [Bordetella pertussis]|nr:Uncharacterised protein [Bordetella pertussis]
MYSPKIFRPSADSSVWPRRSSSGALGIGGAVGAGLAW